MTQGMRIVSFVTIAAALVLPPGRMAAQSGSFPVGHATRLLDVTGTRGETRHVNVHLWYPAPDPQNCQSGNGNSQGCPPSVYTSRLNGIPLLPQWDPLSWTIGSTLSFEELPISNAQPSYPVIIFSHGDRNNAIDYVYTLEALASYGFIVAAPDHVNNTQDDVRIDFVNGQANSTVIPCFDDFPAPPAPCEVLDRVMVAGTDPAFHSVDCPENVLPATTVSVRESMIDRASDVSKIIDALPTWFGSRADPSRIGVMGHSRGTVTAITAAGGSVCWGILADSRVKAVMGLAIGAKKITLRVDLTNVKVPTLLVAGSLDPTRLVSKQALTYLTANPNAVCEITFDTLLLDQCVTIPNAEHPHFDSGYCAQTQSAGAIAQADVRAILDLQTITNLLALPSGAGAKDFCGFETFTSPTDIRPLVFSLTGFDVTPSNVPTPVLVNNVLMPGLTSDEVKDQVIPLAVAFFGHWL